MRRLTASDRSALIKLASSLPSGSPEKKAILAGLKKNSNWAVLSYAFGMRVNAGNAKYITYQPVRRGGKVTSIRLEDRGEQLGHQVLSLDASEALAGGTTLEEVLDFLAANGARLQKRAPSVKSTPPLYD